MTTACAGAHLAHLTVKKAVESSAEILVSVSRRTISGSLSPALANSCKADGIVAENSSVCANTQGKLDNAHCTKWQCTKESDPTCNAVQTHHSPAPNLPPRRIHTTPAVTAVSVCSDNGMNRRCRHSSLCVFDAHYWHWWRAAATRLRLSHAGNYKCPMLGISLWSVQLI